MVHADRYRPRRSARTPRRLLITAAAFVGVVTPAAVTQAVPPGPAEAPAAVQAAPAGEITPGAEVTGRWIVRLDEPALAAYEGGIGGLAPTSPRATGADRLDVDSPASRAYLNHLEQRQDEVVEAMRAALGYTVEVDFRYRTVFDGLTVRVDAADASTLAELPGVAAVYPDTVRELDTDVSNELIGSPAVWDGETGTGLGTRGEGVVVGVIDTGVNPDHPSFAATDGDGYTHTNPYGSGTYVGVCDPDHPQHEGICNDKLIGAWNMHPTSPDARDREGHGSHTASTAAGNRHEAEFRVGGDTFTRTVQGVAPRANIISYLVCSPRCPSSSSVAAVDQAVRDGVDVLNYSISGTDDPWNDPVDLALLDAFDAGMFIAASAGNDGPGEHTVAKTAPWNATVAATTHERVFAHVLDVTAPAPVPPELQSLDAIPGTGPVVSDDIEAPIVDAAVVDEGNATGCAEFGAGVIDGAFALIERGTCAFEVKVDHAAEAGAVGVVVVNDVAGPAISMGELQDTTVPSVMIDRAGGNRLRDILAQAAPVTVNLAADVSLRLDETWSDVMGGFSSRGPSKFEMLAPTFAAPGVNILAAGSGGAGAADEYLMLQGTSMASPHAAGAGALLSALHPEWTPAEIRSALAATADADVLAEDGVTPAGPLDRGSGRLDLDGAGRVGLVMDETAAAFTAADPEAGGDPKALNLPAMVNHGCVDTCSWTRTVRHVADAGVTYTVDVDVPDGMTLTVQPSEFTLDPGDTQRIEVSADVTGLADGDRADAALRLNPGGPDVDGTPIAPAHYPVVVVPMPTAPAMTVEPTNLTSAQAPDETNTQAVTIGNDGDADLVWSVAEDGGSSLMPLGGQATQVPTASGPQSTAARTSAGFTPDATGAHRDDGVHAEPLAEPGAAGQEDAATLTHSASSAVVVGSSIGCTPDSGATTTANAYLRTFTLADFGITGEFEADTVSFGIETLRGAAQTLTVNLYTLDTTPFTYANMTRIGTTEAEFAPQGPSMVHVPVTGTAPEGATLVVEIVAADMTGSGAFYLGANGAGQSAPSYISAPACAQPEPTDMADLGAPDTHIVLSVTGRTERPVCDVPSATAWADVTPASGTVGAGSDQQVEVTFDSTGLSAGTFESHLCLTSNDPRIPFRTIALRLDVEENPRIAVEPGAVDVTVDAGGSTRETLTVANTGLGELEWQIDTAPVSAAREPADDVLYSNGPLVTHPGQGPDGADRSVLENVALGMTTLGLPGGVSASSRLADDVVVTDPYGWDVRAVELYAYQTGSSTASTIDEVNVRIWNGPPGADGSDVVFGDLTTDRLTSTAWTGAYRVSETNLDTARPIMRVVADTDVHLPPGTYWLDWQFGGTLGSGPWQPPVTVAGEPVTGDGLRFDPGSGWTRALDVGSETALGLPFGFLGGPTPPPPCDAPADVAWLGVAPAGGTTPAATADEVSVSIDAAGLEAGSYEARLCVNSNDPVEPRVVVPVTLTVQSPPDITVSGETRKVRTRYHADVAWAGAISEEVDVYRDGDILATTQNDGSYTDELARTNRTAVHTYRICPAGTTVCSDELRLGFGQADHSGRHLPVLVTDG